MVCPLKRASSIKSKLGGSVGSGGNGVSVLTALKAEKSINKIRVCGRAESMFFLQGLINKF